MKRRPAPRGWMWYLRIIPQCYFHLSLPITCLLYIGLGLFISTDHGFLQGKSSAQEWYMSLAVFRLLESKSAVFLVKWSPNSYCFISHRLKKGCLKYIFLVLRNTVLKPNHVRYLSSIKRIWWGGGVNGKKKRWSESCIKHGPRLPPSLKIRNPLASFISSWVFLPHNSYMDFLWL